LLVATDADEATLKLVQAGLIDATIAQKPYTMAFYGLKALDDIHHYPIDFKKDWATNSFSPIPAYVDTGVSLVDKVNVDQWLQQRSEAQGK
jgi:ribose transport system substrate-binding protein